MKNRRRQAMELQRACADMLRRCEKLIAQSKPYSTEHDCLSY